MPEKGRGGGESGSGARGKAVRVRTARQRSASSTRWLQRQLNDPYVAAAQQAGYRSRAAFKLVQLDDRLHFLKRGGRVLDLGAAPGGWCQVASARVGDKGAVFGVDYLPIEPIPGVTLLELDFMTENAPAQVMALIGGGVDVVLSDMAAPTTGHAATDHIRIVALAEAALDFAVEVLRPGGSFLAKVFQGGSEGALLNRLKRQFRTVRHVKPPASRKDSAEIYVVALDFKPSPRPATSAS